MMEKSTRFSLTKQRCAEVEYIHDRAQKILQTQQKHLCIISTTKNPPMYLLPIMYILHTCK